MNDVWNDPPRIAGGLRDLMEVELNPNSLEHGEMDSETGKVEWRTPRPNECAPAVDATVGSLHWVRQVARAGTSGSDVNAVLCPDAVWLWTGSQWRHDGVGDFPSCAYLAGWRYLGSAVPSDKINGMVPWEQMDSWRRRALDLETRGHPSPPAEQRIVKLEEERDAARQDLAVATVQVDMATRTLEARDAEWGHLRSVLDAKNEILATFRSYFRPGVSMTPGPDNNGHLIWWPDRLPIPYFNQDGTVSLLPTSDPGSHDYHGPVQDGRAIPDPVHEGFHRAVGDVLAGRVMPAARRQMEDALKQAPKEPTRAPDAIMRGNRAPMGLIEGWG